MAGTLSGGKLAAATNKARHGEDFYVNIGKRGGKNGHTGGFAANVPCDCNLIEGEHQKRRCAGVKGGAISKRGPNHVRNEE